MVDALEDCIEHHTSQYVELHLDNLKESLNHIDNPLMDKLIDMVDDADWDDIFEYDQMQLIDHLKSIGE